MCIKWKPSGPLCPIRCKLCVCTSVSACVRVGDLSMSNTRLVCCYNSQRVISPPLDSEICVNLKSNCKYLLERKVPHHCLWCRSRGMACALPAVWWPLAVAYRHQHLGHPVRSLPSALWPQQVWRVRWRANEPQQRWWSHRFVTSVSALYIYIHEHL